MNGMGRKIKENESHGERGNWMGTEVVGREERGRIMNGKGWGGS